MKTKLLKRIRKDFIFARVKNLETNYIIYNLLTGKVTYLWTINDIYYYMIGYYFSKHNSIYYSSDNKNGYIEIGKVILKQKRNKYK